MVDFGFREASICWRITRRCNYSCDICLAGDELKYPGEISTQQALQFIYLLRRNGFKRISITGGEPLLREDLRLLIDACVKEGFKVLLATNGSYLNDRWLSFFSNIPNSSLTVRVSIHSSEEGPRCSVAALPFGFDIEKLRALIGMGISTGVSYAACRRNHNNIDEILSGFEHLGLSHFMIQFLLLREKAKDKTYLALSLYEKQQVINNIRHWITTHKPCFHVMYNDHSIDRECYLVIESNGVLVVANDKGNEDLDLGPLSDISLKIFRNSLRKATNGVAVQDLNI